MSTPQRDNCYAVLFLLHHSTNSQRLAVPIFGNKQRYSGRVQYIARDDCALRRSFQNIESKLDILSLELMSNLGLLFERELQVIPPAFDLGIVLLGI